MKPLNKGRILLLAAAAIALIGCILYPVLDGADRTFSLLGLLLAALGAASTLLALLSDLGFAPILPTALYAAAFGVVLRVAIPSLSDVWNHVNFIGGNAALGMTFAGVYLLAALLGVIACFVGTPGEKTK